nr:zinc-binding dehydrogenase [Lentzea atacamensis]
MTWRCRSNCATSTDRIITIADPRAAELGVTFSAGSRPFGAELAEYARLAADGKLVVRVAESLPLVDAGRAQELSASGHARGKLVLRPSAVIGWQHLTHDSTCRGDRRQREARACRRGRPAGARLGGPQPRPGRSPG